MIKRILAFSIILSVLLCFGGMSVSAAEEFTLKAEFDYSGTVSAITVSGTTKAAYGQLLSVVVYDPAFTGGLEDIKLSDGAIPADPASTKPLADVNNIIRIAETTADYDGNWSISIPLDGVTNGQYMIAAVSGGGKQSSGASGSALLYYETQENIDSVTLPAFEKVTKETLEELLTEKQLLLSLDMGEDYQQNKEVINSLFISIREEDYENKFETITDIQNTLKAVDALRTIQEEPTAEEVSAFVRDYGDMTGYDFTDKDFVLSKDEAFELAADIFKEAAPASMKNVKDVLTQSVGMVMMNSKNATTIAPVIEKYALSLGIDWSDYEAACERFGEYEVNKAFVERDFKTAEEVKNALSERVEMLEDEEEDKSSGSSGGSGGGGSGRIVSISSDLAKPDPVGEAAPISYKDVTTSHWAYDAIYALSEKKIIEGYEDGAFEPDEPVSREQLVKMLVIAFGFEVGAAENEFSDVSSERWSAPYISAAGKNGIINGSDGLFMPDAQVSRQDAAVMLARVCDAIGIELSGEAQIADEDAVSEYAKQSVKRLFGAKIISGFTDGSFRPTETLTRAQAAKLIYELSIK